MGTTTDNPNREHDNKVHDTNNGYVCKIDDGGYGGYLNHVEIQYDDNNSVSIFADNQIDLTRLLDYLMNIRPIKDSPWEYLSLDDIVLIMLTSIKMEGLTVTYTENLHNEEGVSIDVEDDKGEYHISYESDSSRKATFSILHSDGKFVDMTFTKGLNTDFREFIKRVVG